jgi:hypothetical protein
MIIGEFKNALLDPFLSLILILSAMTSSINRADAKGSHPIFDRCGEYTVFGIIHCTDQHSQLIQNSGTDSEFRIRLIPNLQICEFYRERPVRLSIQLRSLDPNAKAMIMDRSVHRVTREAMVVPPQLKKESPCD